MSFLDQVNPFAIASRIRNLCFKKGFLVQTYFETPVVSVGNLTMGGSGKTPVTLFLAKWALSQGVRPAIVSRGYGRESKGVMRVDRLSPEGDSLFGDEPFFMSQKLPTVPVYVGAKRVAAVQSLLAKEDVDIIFADDAFQHRYLGRQLNLVVVDALEALKNYRVFPFGRGREPLSSLERADYVFLNKSNMTTKSQLEKVLSMLTKYIEGSKIIFSSYEFGGFHSLNSREEYNPSLSSLLLSGVARPGSVETLLDSNGYTYEEHIKFKDHHPYTLEDIRNIEVMAKSRGILQVLCTQKDSVKIEKFREELDLSWFNFDIKLSTSKEIEGLYEEFRKHTS